MLGAAALIAVIPFAARPFLDFSVEAFDSVSVGTFAGSLFGVLVLVAVPVTMLGAASPWAVRIAVGEPDSTGEVVGRLYAISTFGSLLGTMTSALLFIPLLGTQRTFIAFAFCLALVATIGIGWRAAAVPALLAVLLTVPVGTIKGSGEGEVLYEDETTHQYARVIERDDGSRVLELNEGQAIHSLYRPGEYLTDGYWDGHLVLSFAAQDEPPARIAILGNAGGTVARAFGRYFPETQVDAVEIDGELTELGERFLGLHNSRMTVYEEDARPWLRDAEGGYDAIMVDAYRQPYIPFYLTTEEFFKLCHDRLAPGGVVIVNVGHPESSDELERVLGRTMEAAFPRVMRYPIEDRNTLLVGGDADLSAARLRAAADTLPDDLEPLALDAAAALEPRLEGGEVYTDDHAPVEWLIDESLLEYANE